MKKMIAMAFVAITMMTSCSDDDSSNTNDPGTDAPLLKKIIETYDGETYTINFNYDGNKLTSYTADDGFEAEFTYASDKITKMEAFDEGELISRNLYEYHADGKLAKHIEIDYYDGDSYGTKTLFNHNSNGTISIEVLIGDETTQTTAAGTGTITMVNGNIESVSIITEDGDEWEYTYTYDNKHDPYKNIASFETLILSDLQGGVNNVLSETDTEWGDEMTTTYTYNSQGYPVTSSDTYNDEPDGDYEYFYE